MTMTPAEEQRANLDVKTEELLAKLNGSQAAAATAVAPLTPFEQRALPLIERNVPVVPLRPKSKIAFITEWQDKATTDPAKIKEWGQESPDANVASVAKAQSGGVWFFDADRAGLADQIEQQTGKKIP